MTRRFAALGIGVNSTAQLLKMHDDPQYDDVEYVFVNHGCDYPETYEYLDLLRSKGYAITELYPNAEGYDNLYDYSFAKGVVPYRLMRWCTAKFKQDPMYRYFDTPCEVFIGIDADEPHRAKDSRREGITNVFPLVDEGIGRQGCIDIIKAHGLPVPPKSGCYFCPFQPRSQWVALNKEHPELWCKAVSLEANAIERQIERGGDPANAILCKRPLPELIRTKDARGRYADDDQLDLFDDRRPCQCGL